MFFTKLRSATGMQLMREYTWPASAIFSGGCWYYEHTVVRSFDGFKATRALFFIDINNTRIHFIYGNPWSDKQLNFTVLVYSYSSLCHKGDLTK